MPETALEDHICDRMIQIIESKGLVLTKFEEKWREEGKISVGYLARAAKQKTNIGINLIDNFLQEFPDTDVQWLITGVLPRNEKPKKHTAATKDDEAAVSEDRKLLLDELLAEVRVLRTVTGQQSETILNLSRSITMTNQG